MPDASAQPLLETVAHLARDAGVFSSASLRDSQVVCVALASAAPASYRVRLAGERAYVSLVMADRWLSESIETDLLHSGDDPASLVAEEYAEIAGIQPSSPIVVEHFRSEDLLFTFQTPLPIVRLRGPDAAQDVLHYLLAYEAAFRLLGDMDTREERAAS